MENEDILHLFLIWFDNPEPVINTHRIQVCFFKQRMQI